MRLPPIITLVITLSSTLAVSAESWVRWNQQGYAPDHPKHVVVMSDQDLAGHAWQVFTADSNDLALAGSLGKSVTGIGPNTPFDYNQCLDLSSLSTVGKYRLKVADAPDAIIEVKAAPYAALANLPLIHLRMQRSGTDAVLWRRASHLQDNAALLMVPHGPLENGQWQPPEVPRQVDVAGGWYDAGDHIKFTLTTSYTAYHLSLAYEVAPEIFVHQHSLREGPDILDEIHHGLTYLLKLWPDPDTFIVQVGDTNDHNLGWRLPADDILDGQRPAMAALARVQMASTVATLARGARVMREFDATLAERCAVMARALMQRAQETDTVEVAFESTGVNDFYHDNSERDQLALAALELAALDQDRAWIKTAREYAPGPGKEVGWQDWHWLANSGLTAANVPEGRHGLESEIKSYLQYAELQGQPWGIPSRYVWGSLARWIGAANATRVAAYLGAVSAPASERLFTDVIDYVFGRNNWGVSFLFDERVPNHLHELYSPTSYLLNRYPTGALSAGPASRRAHEPMEKYFDDEDDGALAAFDTAAAVFHDHRHDFVCHESTIGAQADIVLMLALAARPEGAALLWEDLP